MAREPRKRLRSGVLVLALFVAFFWPATAGATAESPAEFLEASAKAYAPYRSAMSYLKTGNPGLAALALDATAARWATLCDRFRDRPPGAFAKDPDWQASLDGITGRIADARAKLEAGDAKGARTALAPVRADLGDLRRRNGIETFSDRIDAFSAAMDAIWVHRRNPPDMTDPEALAALAEQAAALRRALEHVAAEPPEKTAADLQFQRLVAGALGSIATIDRAIEAGNSALLISALREIHSSEQLLWMNFG
jgi:hypothetical protein